jgi:Domain of unknown function (DUF4173)
MTPSMTPSSFALPSRVSFADRLRPQRSQLLLGLALGLAAEVLLDGADFGLGHALFAVLTATLVALQGGREAWQQAGAHRWVLLASVLLFGSTMLHTSTWLAVMSTVSAVLLFTLAVQGWTGERPLAQLRTGQLFGAPFKTFGQAVHAGAVVTNRELEQGNVGTTVAKYGPGAFRLGVIVLPPVLVLMVLLSSGDAVFRARLSAIETAIFGVPLEGFLRGSFVTFIAGMLLTGVLALAARRRDVIAVSAPRRGLKAFETFALLGSLTTMLFFYGVTSTPCALAPSSCELPAGVTYADAAHEGFFQLLFAAIGILLLLMALPARTQLEGGKAQLTFTSLSTALVLATMPMVISGMARLWRYETTYGLTVLRLLAYAGLILVSAVLAWRALTLWTMKESFVLGAIALFTATMLSLSAMAPDRFIAHRNLQMQNVDFGYLLSLSEDVVPELVAARPDLLSDAQWSWLDLYRAHLGASESWLTWNLGRSQARHALR